jgi:predicted nucleic acid-binding protein
MRTEMRYVRDITRYTFSSTDKILPDANFWAYIWGPPGQDEGIVRAYSDAFKRIKTVNAEMFTSVLIIGEYVNVLLKESSKAYWRKNFDHVDFDPKRALEKFKSSVDFVPEARAAGEHARRVLGLAEAVKLDYDTDAVADALIAVENGDRDFNDEIIYETCVKGGFVLITHDRDFAGCPIPILTYNSRLLCDPPADHSA